MSRKVHVVIASLRSLSHTRRLPWIMLALAVLMTAVAVILLVLQQGHNLPTDAKLNWYDAIGQVGLLIFPIMGAFIASRQRGNRIGWLFCIVGLLWSFYIFIDAYALHALLVAPERLPAGTAVAWIASGLIPVVVYATMMAFFLLFPTGHLPSNRWRPVVWLAVISLAIRFVGTSFHSGPLLGYEFIDNPLGIDGASTFLTGLDITGSLLAPLVVLAGAVSQVIRFRRATGDERLQIKWFAYSAALTVVAIVVAVSILLLGMPDAVGGAVIIAAIMGIPITAGLAILKYRLYEIDFIINRTLVYGLVMIALGSGYVIGVVMLQQFLAPITQGSDAAITLATVCVVFAFQPVRNRTQSLVDRRFYRHKYDARQTVDAFSARLREEIDLDTLRLELCGLVTHTMHPTHVSVWFNPISGPANATTNVTLIDTDRSRLAGSER